MRKGMEREWKWNGKGMKEKKQKSSGNKVNWKGMELEQKWDGKFSIKKDNGMEVELKKI